MHSAQLDNEIHIWSAILDQPDTIVDGYYSILSDNEQRKVNKYKSKKLRNEQIMSMGLLRVLIAKYTNYSLNEINFLYNEFGKPFLSPDSKGNKLSFNLSHSGNIAVFVFSRNREVGIDVEKIKELTDMEGVVDLCFSESEKKWFNNLPPYKKEEMFYKIWTDKEAYIKAIGKGLSFSPNNISLEQRSDDELFFKEIIGDENLSRWKLVTFNPHPGFISSIVVEGFTIEYFSLDPQSIFNNDYSLFRGKKLYNCKIKSFPQRN